MTALKVIFYTAVAAILVAVVVVVSYFLAIITAAALFIGLLYICIREYHREDDDP